MTGSVMLSPQPNNPVNHWLVRLWTDYCSKFAVHMPEYEPLEEIDQRRNSMMEGWQTYASRFSIAAAEEQLPPDEWGKEFPEPDTTGKVNALDLKHWQYWGETRAFLRERYGVLPKASLTFDCQVPSFQRPVPIPNDHRDLLGYPKYGDPPEWYADAIRMTIFNSQIRFRCRSGSCGRFSWCELKKRRSVDIYGLVKVFHCFIKMVPAIKIVGDWFGVDLIPPPSQKGNKTGTHRFKVSCEAIEDLINKYSDLRDLKIGSGEKLKSFLKEAKDLIRFSPREEYQGRPASQGYVYVPQSVVYQGTLWTWGSATRLWLWVWCYQSDKARRRRKRINEFKPSDAKLAKMWGVDRDTVKTQRKKLEKLGYFRIEDGEWKVFVNARKS